MPYHVVTVPEATPARHSLVDSATVIDEPSNYWEAGLTFDENGCALPVAVEIDCPPGAMSTPVDCVGTDEARAYSPYMIELAIERPAGSFSEGRVAEIARTNLQVSGTAAMEDVLINGLTGTTNAYLGASAGLTEVTAGTPVKPAVALGLIQEALAERAAHGTLHASPLVVNLLPDLVEGEENKLFTKVRHDLVVVANVGTSGPGQAPADAGSRFIFAHLGEPELRMSEIDVQTTLDHATNRWTARATRIVAVTFDPCLRLAAEVTIA